MINTMYNSISETLIGKTTSAPKSITRVEERKNADKSVETKRDTFEYHNDEKSELYSPKTIKSVDNQNKVNSILSKDVATTDAERRLIPKYLAAKMANLNYGKSTGTPYINSGYESQAYQKALDTIKGDHATLNYSSSYCYRQKDGTKYGYTNYDVCCPTYALATALSIKNKKMITPDMIQTNSAIDGTNPQWKQHGATKLSANEEEAFFALDAQLQLGNPALLHINGKNVATDSSDQHWVTVVGKKDDDYIVIDPWDGVEKKLSDVSYYANGGTIADYVIISDEY